MGSRAGWVIAGCWVFTSACQDGSVVTEPAARQRASASVTQPTQTIIIDGIEYPRYPDESYVPSDWCMPRIDRAVAYAYWSASEATYLANMNYCGNVGEITTHLKVDGPAYSGGPTPSVTSAYHLFPFPRYLSTEGQKWNAPGACGYTVNLSAELKARLTIYFDAVGLREISPKIITRSYGASQPSCSSDCSDDTMLTSDPNYDPYSDGGSGCDDGTRGSGTQFAVGDYTNGETVDWGTAIGNGGSSMCGAAAVVEYICIDIWNEQTNTWEEWSCGYATTC